MSQQRIAFVGGGNMATSLIGGLLARGIAATDIVVADPDAGQRERREMTQQHGHVRCTRWSCDR